MVDNTTPLQGSVRWAFDYGTWNPTLDEWLLASQCVPLQEKLRIQKFVFKSDAKASMAGCLMIRKLAHLATGVPYNKVNVVRDEGGRPYINNKPFPIDFNVSHQGSFTVLAGEVRSNVEVGVDVMNFETKSQQELPEFFRLMNRSFSDSEWSSIMASKSTQDQCYAFYRHWSLKESYVKAIGIGLCTDLQRISFNVKTASLHPDRPCTDTTVSVDGVENSSWVFHEWLLDSQHCVSVALSPRSVSVSTLNIVEPVPFQMLSWSDLVNEADPLLPPDENYCKIFMCKEEKAMIH